MKTATPPLFDHRTEEQASLWAARLRSGPLTAAQRDELHVWLDQHATHRSALDAFCEDSADFDAALAVLREDGAMRLESTGEKPARRWRGLAVAGALAAAAGLAFVFWPAPAEIFSTPAGRRGTFTLADGSTLNLNGHTTVSVRLKHSERRIQLEQGEVLFSVAKDPDRPFFVTTPHGVVRVTGTVFNVRADAPEGEEVTVLEGTVLVGATENSRPVALHPGDQALLAGEIPSVQALPPGALARVTSWREGRLVFEGESLRAALDRMAWYHGRRIDVSTRLDGLTLGGRYDLDDFDAFLRDVARVLPVQVIRGENGDVRVVPK